MYRLLFVFLPSLYFLWVSLGLFLLSRISSLSCHSSLPLSLGCITVASCVPAQVLFLYYAQNMVDSFGYEDIYSNPCLISHM